MILLVGSQNILLAGFEMIYSLISAVTDLLPYSKLVNKTIRQILDSSQISRTQNNIENFQIRMITVWKSKEVCWRTYPV